jgi:dipeptidase D
MINNLQPSIIWHYFNEICKIPRPSKKEDLIIKYLHDFAHKFQLQIKTDTVSNVLIKKKASKGFENKPLVVLQSHLDMVCEKNETTIHNFETEPIKPYIDGEWVKARGTTLGGDDGIGIAAQLAILSSENIQHGPLECLFTVDEETGLSGAFALEQGFFEGRILLNLDSEDEGVIFIGCAGGVDTTGLFNVKTEQFPLNNLCFRIGIAGLQGGHSGDDIHKGLGNAIKIITRIGWHLFRNYNIKIIDLGGGNLRNAIAREAFIEFACELEQQNSIRESIQKIFNQITAELRFTEKNLQISVSQLNKEHDVLSEKSAKKLLSLLYALPHGVAEMSHTIEGLVETSTNLASVKRIDSATFEIATSQRSASNTRKQEIMIRVATTFKLGGAHVSHSVGYPGWSPNPSSAVLKLANESYLHLFAKKPLVTAIHAGLECGLFLEKYPDLDMISFGPTIRGAHSPDERIGISSVEKFWDFLLDMLKRL